MARYRMKRSGAVCLGIFVGIALIECFHIISNSVARNGIVVENLYRDLPGIAFFRYQAVQNPQIPRIIHQTWKSSEIPMSVLQWSNACRSMHKSYKYILWTDEMNRALVKDYYSWFLGIYDALPNSIMQADAARLFYMHRYGGVYLDLDFECLRPMDPLLLRGGVLLGATTDNLTKPDEHSIPNSWMASVPGHNFWILSAMRLACNFYDPTIRHKPESLSGSLVVGKSYFHWRSHHEKEKSEENDVSVLGSDLVNPFNWQFFKSMPYCRPGKSFNTTRCKNDMKVKEKGSYVISYWIRSWQ